MKLPLTRLAEEFGLAPGLVVHAGANLCQERAEYEKSGFRPVIWIEALDTVVQEAQKLLIPFQNQKILQAVLWSKSNVELPFTITSNNAESSSVFDLKWHQALHPHISKRKKVSLQSQTLDSLLLNEFVGSIPDITLLVFDLQGAEFEALLGASLTLKQARAIHIEVSIVELYENQKLFKDIADLLSVHDFVLVDHDLKGNVVSGDALFVNSSYIKDFDPVELPNDRKIPRVPIKQWLKYFLIRSGVSADYIQNFSAKLKKRK